MPAAPPDAAASAFARRTADENTDSCLAGVPRWRQEFPQRVPRRVLAHRSLEARQIPRPASRALPIEFLGFLYPACAEFHLTQNTTPVSILTVPIPTRS